MVFATEFAFSLPKGFVDGAGRLHREGTMRLATAKDEILPLADARVRNNRAYMAVVLLARVVTRLGDLKEDQITTDLIESLFAADLAYLQDFYRQINDNATTPGTVCPSCGYTLTGGSDPRAPDATIAVG